MAQPMAYDRSGRLRSVRAAGLGALLAAALLLAGGCSVDKAALAAQVGLHEVDFTRIADGTYQAEYRIKPPRGAMAASTTARVRVSVAGGRLTGVEMVGSRNDVPDYVKKLISRVVSSQSLGIDAVSSGTITSMAVLRAIQEAVSKAAP
jgi:uncharacterized protein with FMN-binding domain